MKILTEDVIQDITKKRDLGWHQHTETLLTAHTISDS